MSKTIITGALAAILVTGAASAGLAQHEGHTTAGQQASGMGAEQVTACVQSQQRVMALVEAANQRLEVARQTNETAAMRGAMDDLQATLSAIRSELASCVQQPAATPAAQEMPCCAPQPSAAAADAHAGHTMPAAPQADLIKDPRCRQDVDPKTAPQASHDGRTYYFCSESDRQRFAADPVGYLQAAPGAQEIGRQKVTITAK